MNKNSLIIIIAFIIISLIKRCLSQQYPYPIKLTNQNITSHVYPFYLNFQGNKAFLTGEVLTTSTRLIFLFQNKINNFRLFFSLLIKSLITIILFQLIADIINMCFLLSQRELFLEHIEKHIMTTMIIVIRYITHWKVILK